MQWAMTPPQSYAVYLIALFLVAGGSFYIGALRAFARAPMAELVDASDSKSDSARSAGSIPARGTNPTTMIKALSARWRPAPH